LRKKEIADAEMEPPEEAAGRPVGLKRARSAAIGNGSCGITSAMIFLYMHALSVSYAACTSGCAA
jgi:hypothetical protein